MSLKCRLRGHRHGKDGQKAAARIEELEQKVKKLIDFIKTAPVSSGVCCCGDSVDHGAWNAGHTPVDMLDWSVHCLLEEMGEIE